MPDRGACPYEDLHIYYLKGAVPETWEAAQGDAYLGAWVEDGDSFLFFTRPAEAEVGALLRGGHGLTFLDAYTMPYEQWQGDGTEPFAVGPLYVAPPWSRAEPPAGAVLVRMDPGVVFGTGWHPTTRDCLEFLVEAAEAAPLGRVLDLGTGTGVLALAAAALGAKSVCAVDLNPLAVRTTLRNARANGAADRVRAVCGGAVEHAGTDADLLVANIHYAVMKDLLDSPGFAAKKRFILSGLLRSEAPRVLERLEALPVRITGRRVWDNTWFTLAGEAR